VKLLVKEIKSKQGIVHFRRYRLLKLPWFAVYLHHILRADEDSHEHTHPWNFLSIVLRGCYTERSLGKVLTRSFLQHPIAYSNRIRPHKILELKRPTWTLFFTFGRHQDNWGYDVDGSRIEHEQYREFKRLGWWD